MATSAIIGRGTTLAYETTVGGGTYTTISEVFSVTGPEIEAAEVEATHFGSPGLSREYIAGLEEPGSCSFELNYTKTVLAALLSIKGVTRSWKITYPDSSTWVFSGNLSGVSVNDPDADRITMNAAIKVSGAPTFTAA